MKHKINVISAIFSAIVAGAMFKESGIGFAVIMIGCIINLWLAGLFAGENL